MSSDAMIGKLIDSDKFENVALALNLAIGQKSELAFSASERYVELFCERDGNKAAGDYTTLNTFPTDFASESAQMAELFGMLPHECFQQFPFFVEKGVQATLQWAYCEDDMRAQRAASGAHEMNGRYWR